MKKPAFTLIELLVVIVIIGILATISVAVYNRYQEQAREAVVTAEMNQLKNALMQARITSQKYLVEISSDSCTRCEDACTNYDLRNVDTSNNCYQVWKSFLDDFSAESGIDLAGFDRDPWGNPYLLDENEHEINKPNPCTQDQILSAGPDGYWYTSTTAAFTSSERGRTSADNNDNVTILLPNFDPNCN